jgi:hypothetical protein
MTLHGVWIFIAFATILMIGSLLFSISRSTLLTASLLVNIRTLLQQLNEETRILHRELRRHPGAVDSIHKYIVPKGSSKPDS